MLGGGAGGVTLAGRGGGRGGVGPGGAGEGGEGGGGGGEATRMAPWKAVAFQKL